MRVLVLLALASCSHPLFGGGTIDWSRPDQNSTAPPFHDPICTDGNGCTPLYLPRAVDGGADARGD